jgi:hypothetical protein
MQLITVVSCLRRPRGTGKTQDWLKGPLEELKAAANDAYQVTGCCIQTPCIINDGESHDVGVTSLQAAWYGQDAGLAQGPARGAQGGGGGGALEAEAGRAHLYLPVSASHLMMMMMMIMMMVTVMMMVMVMVMVVVMVVVVMLRLIAGSGRRKWMAMMMTPPLALAGWCTLCRTRTGA